MGMLESYWVKIPWWFMGKASRLIWLGFVGLLLVAILALTLYMNSLPSLSTWHTTILENEFTTDSDVKDFDAYLAL